MSRTIPAGGRVFDGTGAPPRDADRIAAVRQDGRRVAGRA